MCGLLKILRVNAEIPADRPESTDWQLASLPRQRRAPLTERDAQVIALAREELKLEPILASVAGDLADQFPAGHRRTMQTEMSQSRTEIS